MEMGTFWRREDEIPIRKMAVRLTNKKWELIKVCLDVIEENGSMVNDLTIKDKQRMNIAWNIEDAKNVKSFKMKNIRFLSLKSGKAKIGMKENVLEMFYEQKGWNEKKEDWRKNFEKEIDLKDIKLKELILKKKLAKSKKRKFEIFKECKGMLYTLVKNWEETPRMEEERMFAKLKESVQNERCVCGGVDLSLITRLGFGRTAFKTMEMVG